MVSIASRLSATTRAQAKAVRRLLGLQPGPTGVAPYAEWAPIIEDTGAEFVTDVYREFLSTDARTAMIRVYPNHWNFFPNPALRASGAGWDSDGFTPASPVHSGTATSDGAANVAMITGFPALDGQTAAIAYSGSPTTTLIKFAGALLVQSAVPFPISGNISDWRVWDAVADSLDTTDSWVGKSVKVSGDGTLRFRQGGFYTYVGPEQNLPPDITEWYEPGRCSDKWRFSAYFKGEGEVRLSMRAYQATDPFTAASPPLFYNAIRVAGPPTSWPHGYPSVIQEVVGADGGPEDMAWNANPAPYYKSLGVPYESGSGIPTSLTKMYFMEPLLEQVPGDYSVWEVTAWQAAGPYYTRWGIPDLKPDPSGEAAGVKYLRHSGDMSLWVLKGAVYVRASVKQDPSPATVQPDFNSMPKYMTWSDVLYKSVLPPPATQTGIYVLAGDPTHITGDDEQNMLTDNQASGTDTLGTTAGFLPSASTTLSSSTVWFATGSRSLLLTCASGTGVEAQFGVNTVGGTGTIPVVASQKYTLTVAARSTTVTSINLNSYFYNAAGTYISGVSGGGTASAAGTTSSTVVTAPVGAVTAAIRISSSTGMTVGQTLALDKFGLWKGTGGAWAMPGTVIINNDPTTMPPGDQYLVEPDGETWERMPPPYYTSTEQPPYFAEVSSQWMPVAEMDGWTRWSVRTGHKQGTSATTAVSFAGVYWIDALIEVRDAVDLRMSAFLLDPCEFPMAEYFDGDMVEQIDMDDYMWDGTANASVSMYWYQRKARFEWLYNNLFYAVPVGRPYQIFSGGLNHPYSATAPPQWEAQFLRGGLD